MPNHYFRFKQFTVYQQHCAMKVCTDACLFGAWVARFLNQEKKFTSIKNILDIGAGTGLLSLMLAQQLAEVRFTAVEIERNAAMQAAENFEQSPCNHQLQVENTAIQDFQPDQKFDFIISNPPFYENDLRSENLQRNIALHSAQLTLPDLIMNIDRLLENNGSFAVLLPYNRFQYFEALAQNAGFYLYKKTDVAQTEKHSGFRSMLWFGKEQQAFAHDETAIKNNNQYTVQFVDLLKDYYFFL